MTQGSKSTDAQPSRVDPLGLALARNEAVWAREHLEHDAVAWLTTMAPDGRLQSSLISFVYADNELLLYSDPKAPKVRNLEASPHVSFHLQSDPFGDHWLIVEGRAVVDPTVLPLDEHPAYVAKFASLYPHWGLDLKTAARDVSAAIRIEPTHVRVG
jgi:PPOX class probable F420-dependent enzyme